MTGRDLGDDGLVYTPAQAHALLAAPRTHAVPAQSPAAQCSGRWDAPPKVGRNRRTTTPKKTTKKPFRVQPVTVSDGLRGSRVVCFLLVIVDQLAQTEATHHGLNVDPRVVLVKEGGSVLRVPGTSRNTGCHQHKPTHTRSRPKNSNHLQH